MMLERIESEGQTAVRANAMNVGEMLSNLSINLMPGGGFPRMLQPVKNMAITWKMQG